MDTIVCTQERDVLHVRLNRPEVKNAFNDVLISEFQEVLRTLDPKIRVLILSGEGPIFSAGADLAWMQKSAGMSHDENVRETKRMGALFHLLDTTHAVTVARVQGAALGGGLGLVACCDIVVAEQNTRFGLTEVRLGLAPAVISPFVLKKMPLSAARRYFLTGEMFDANAALSCGLVHHVCGMQDLDLAVQDMCSKIRRGGPEAVKTAKKLIADVAGKPAFDVSDMTAEIIATLRTSPEALEGLGAFLQKRDPQWM